MPKCEFCKKEFRYESKLVRHQNGKKKCNAPKKEYKCDICNITCKCPAELDRHLNTKRCKDKHIANHITNVQNNINNITNNINYNINQTQNNIYLTLQINGFEHTNLEVIQRSLFNWGLDHGPIHKNLKLIDKKFEYIDYDDDDYEYKDKKTVIKDIFDIIMVYFEKLNFNLSYEQNHNCRIIIFLKSQNSNFIEYHIIEFDSVTKQYSLHCIKFEFFIDRLLHLMERVNKKFEDDRFSKLLKFLNENKELILEDEQKIYIEDKLYKLYNDFQKMKTKNSSYDDLHKENEKLLNDCIIERNKML
jgi:hypothetical protein